MAKWNIEPLTGDHERGGFACGKAPLDEYLHRFAGQYSRKGIGRTYVAVRPGERRVIGYYTLAASSIEFDHIPRKLAKKLPEHPIPVILLGRLAVDLSARGQRLGRDLLVDSFRRVLELAEQVGIFAIHVHAIDDEAKAFYTRHDFQSLLDQDRHLLITLKTVREAFADDT